MSTIGDEATFKFAFLVLTLWVALHGQTLSSSHRQPHTTHHTPHTTHHTPHTPHPTPHTTHHTPHTTHHTPHTTPHTTHTTHHHTTTHHTPLCANLGETKDVIEEEATCASLLGSPPLGNDTHGGSTTKKGVGEEAGKRYGKTFVPPSLEKYAEDHTSGLLSSGLEKPDNRDVPGNR